MEHHVRGFALIEVILTSALLLILVTALGGALLYGQESMALAGNRARAVFLADEGLEAVRNIRDEDYGLLVNGTYGLSSAGGIWELVGTSDATGIFTRSLTIADAGANAKEIASIVTWPQNAQRTGSVSVVTRLSGWTVPPPSPPPAP